MGELSEIQKVLKRYRTAKYDLIVKMQTLEELKDDALSLPQLGGNEGRSSMPSDKVGNYAVRLAEFKRSVERERLKALEQLQEVKELIEGIENERSKAILSYKYIKGYSIRRIAKAVNLTERKVVWLLKQGEKEALEKFHVQKISRTL